MISDYSHKYNIEEWISKRKNIPFLISASLPQLEESSKSSFPLISESFCELLVGRFGMFVPIFPSWLRVGRLGGTMLIVSPLISYFNQSQND